MRHGLIAPTLLMLVMFAFLATGCSGRFETADEEAAKTIPDLSGIWEEANERRHTAQDDICGEPSCGALQNLPRPEPLIITIEEPQMLPWAEEKYKAARSGIEDSNAFGPDETNPWFSACIPSGPAGLMLSPFVAFELRQFPDIVLLLYGDDHAVRRVYMDGRRHPAGLKPTWMGYSIGRYDGDTLVVDTVGIHDTPWIDPQGHPHSDALHLIERIRRVNQKSLEVEVTIDDPKAYKKAWRKKIVRELRRSGNRIFEDVLCEELLQMGTHYSAESPR